MRNWIVKRFDALMGAGAAAAASGAAERLLRLVTRVARAPWFEQAIVALIIVNALLLGLETSKSFMAAFGGVAYFLNGLILWIFTVEIAMRLLAEGRGFFRSGWSVFDLAVVIISWLPELSGLAALRAFRIFRLFRLFSLVPKMRRVINGFFAAMPGMAGVIGVLTLIFYVSAVITTTVFGQAELSTPPPGATAEDLETMRTLYGTLGASFFTLFQLMTLEDWAGAIVQPTMRVFPNALFFFIPYIVVTSFAVLNLFIGIIVDAMQDDRDEAEQKARNAEAEEAAAEDAARALEADRVRRHDLAQEQRRFEALQEELRALRLEIASLRENRGR